MADVDKVCAIYLLFNKVNGKRYIGSTINLAGRIRTHFSDLRLNKHGNPLLQEEYNIYGEKSFELVVLRYLDTDNDIRQLEQQWIEWCDPEYNITMQNSPFSPKVFTTEARKQVEDGKSDRLSAYYATDDGQIQAKIHSERMKRLWETGQFNPNLTHDDRVRAGKLGAIAQQATGYKHSEETKKKIGESNKKTYVGAVSPSGIIYAPIIGMQDFCKEHNLGVSSMVAVMRGRRKHHKGWTKYEPDSS